MTKPLIDTFPLEHGSCYVPDERLKAILLLWARPVSRTNRL
jgi:hypothetical protein